MPRSQPIKRDYRRWRKILKGEIRENLQDLMSKKIAKGRRAGKYVDVPIKIIEIPQFEYDIRQMGAVGAGKGDVGQPIPSPEGGWEEAGQPGKGHGGEEWGAEVEKEELAEILGEELNLPDIEPKGRRELVEGEQRWSKIRKAGPESQLLKKRYFKKALQRGEAYGEADFDEYLKDLRNPAEEAIELIEEKIKKEEDPKLWLYWRIESNPKIEKYERRKKARKSVLNFIENEMEESPAVAGPDPMFDRDDKRYRLVEPEERPEFSAVVIHLMDRSGSMMGEKREIAQNVFFWTDLWLEHQYDEVEHVYILHDYTAEEVSREDFYKTSASGGTRISSAYELLEKIINDRYPPEEWNIYPIHLSDGENFGDDSDRCVKILKGGKYKQKPEPFYGTVEEEEEYEGILDKINMFAFGEIKSTDWAVHKDILDKKLGDVEKVRTTKVKSMDDVQQAIKDFFGGGY